MSLMAMLVFGLTGLTFAQGKPLAGKAINAKKAEAKKGPCAADVQKFCAGVEKKKGNVQKCLVDNRAKLSPACEKTLPKGPAIKAIKQQKLPGKPAKKPAIPAAEGC